MNNIIDISKIRKEKEDNDLQKELNDIWDAAVNSGIIYTNTDADNLFQARLRDKVVSILEQKNLINVEEACQETVMRKLSTILYDEDAIKPDLNKLAELIAEEFNFSIGYLISIMANRRLDIEKPWMSFMIKLHLKTA
jgi:hypothetical protein